MHASLLRTEDLDSGHVARDGVALDGLAPLGRASDADEARKAFQGALVVRVTLEFAARLDRYERYYSCGGEERIEPIERRL